MAAPEFQPLLTPRQLEVLELMAQGLRNREIAGALGIAPATAKNHVAAVIEALEVSNRTEAATALHDLGLGGGQRSDPDHRVPGFGERPALAVLPFEALSEESDGSFLAAGIVEDLVARLASWRWFPVISRSSTLVYRGGPSDAKDAGRALGVRYVVAGSVRRTGGRALISSELIDTVSEEVLWAQRYDRELGDLLTTLDEIVGSLVTTLEPALARIGGMRALTRSPRELGAWECLQRGFLRLSQHTAEETREARLLFERAIALEDDLCPAYAGLAFAWVLALLYQDTEDRSAAAAQVLDLSRRAIALEPRDAIARFTLGFGHLYAGDPIASAAAFAEALELNPSVVWGHGGLGVAYCAQSPPRAAEAETEIGKAIRLSPLDPMLPYLLVARANALSLQGRLEEALALHEHCLHLAPRSPFGYGGMAYNQVALGRIEDARATLERLAEIAPSYSPIEQARAYVAPELLPFLRDALATAGWAEPHGDESQDA